ncbi:MAG: type II secretion system protein [Planctomycetes bacterium]|nr:type II secretion system protein [Planctomycetota bacterium]
MRVLTDRRRGSTLVLVLIAVTLLALLAFSTGGLARHASREAFSERERVRATYAAEGALEALRLQLIRHYEASGLSPRAWLRALQDDHAYRVYGVLPSNGVAAPVEWSEVGPRPVPPPPGSAATGAVTYTALPGVRAWIDLVSYEQGWIELVAGTDPSVGERSEDERIALSVRLRLSVYRNAIFDLAMLAETVNCMFCHLHVRGDVGSIGFFRPGLGTENGKGRYTGAGSHIVGDVYVGDRASDDSDWNGSNDTLEDARLINGTRVSGSVQEHYRGPYLPEDTFGNDGIPDFPTFDPAQVERRARSGEGSLRVEGGVFGGRYSPGAHGVWIVPFGVDWDERGDPGTGALTLPPEQTRVIDGNLVILGSEDDRRPISIAGNVFVRGDVVIRGRVTGRGAIYAGRNVYLVGDLRYVDQPIGRFPLRNDQAGVEAIEQGVSELRIAARSNVVLGDWTYEDEHADLRRVAERQAQDFMRAQFDLDRVRFYEAANDGSIVSSELRQDPKGGGFFDDRGRPVGPDRIARVDDGRWVGRLAKLNPLRYDAALAPGRVIRTGRADEVGGAEFDPWLSQTDFREILGTKRYNLITVRVPGTSDPGERAFELGPEWVAAHGANLPRSVDQSKRRLFDADLLRGGEVGMLISGGFDDELWRAALIAKDPEVGVDWPTQVEHVDAFLFAHGRIAGKSDRGSLTVNGGLAASEIGVLAPGWHNVFLENTHLLEGSDEIPRWVFSAFRPGHADHPRNAYGHLATKSWIYYDYRLRNGGFGFDFLASLGDTLLYTRGGRAAPPRGAELQELNHFPLR